jgi:hypothetical protein
MPKTYADVVSEWRSGSKLVKLPNQLKLSKGNTHNAVAVTEENISVYCRDLDYTNLSVLPTSCFLKYDINKLLNILWDRVCDEQMWECEDEDYDHMYNKFVRQRRIEDREKYNKIRHAKYRKCCSVIKSKFKDLAL